MIASNSSRHVAPTVAAARLSPYLLLGILLLAAAVRVPFLSHVSWDFTQFLRPWYEQIDRQGMDAFATRFSDYAPPYLYFLGLASEVPVPPLVAIKAFSLVFDVVLAFATLAVVRHCELGPKAQATAFALVLLAPTIVLNSAAWGQCDALYVSLLVSALALLQRKRWLLATILVGIAFAFKVQTVFFFPVLAVLTLRRELPLRAWFVLPVPYLLAIIPSWIAGRPLMDLLQIYRGQADQYPKLTMGAPSIYTLVDVPQWFLPYLTNAALGVVGFATLAAWLFGPRANPRGLLKLATFFAILVPFVLPHMHDRYFYPADALAISYAVVYPRRWYVPVLVVGASFLAYIKLLWAIQPLPFDVLTIFMGAALAIVARDVFAAKDRVSLVRPLLVAMPLATRLLRLQLTRFAIIGGFCTVAYLALYIAFRTQFPALSSNALALSLTVGVNFAANRRWTFARVNKPLSRQMLEYAAAYLFGLAISTAALAAAMAIAGDVPRLIEAALAVSAGLLATITRFILMRRVVFSDRPLRRLPKTPPGGTTARRPT